MITLFTADSPPVPTTPTPENCERRLYVVDDNSDIRRSLHFSLAAVGITAWPFVCAQDFLDQVLTLPPAPILLDVRMPETSGLELLAILRERDVQWPVIMMSAHGDIPIAVRAVRLGAVDFLEKPFNFGDLEKLLFQAYTQAYKVVQDSESRNAARDTWERLTAREAQVVDSLLTGLANKGVARELGITVRTVENHRARALSKLELKSLAQVSRLRLLIA